MINMDISCYLIDLNRYIHAYEFQSVRILINFLFTNMQCQPSMPNNVCSKFFAATMLCCCNVVLLPCCDVMCCCHAKLMSLASLYVVLCCLFCHDVCVVLYFNILIFNPSLRPCRRPFAFWQAVIVNKNTILLCVSSLSSTTFVKQSLEPES